MGGGGGDMKKMEQFSWTANRNGTAVVVEDSVTNLCRKKITKRGVLKSCFRSPLYPLCCSEGSLCISIIIEPWTEFLAFHLFPDTTKSVRPIIKCWSRWISNRNWIFHGVSHEKTRSSSVQEDLIVPFLRLFATKNEWISMENFHTERKLYLWGELWLWIYICIYTSTDPAQKQCHGWLLSLFLCCCSSYYFYYYDYLFFRRNHHRCGVCLQSPVK